MKEIIVQLRCGRTSSASANSAGANSASTCILEKCGRWLSTIPREHVPMLNQTSEFHDFLNAFDRLGQAHRRVIADSKKNEDDITVRKVGTRCHSSIDASSPAARTCASTSTNTSTSTYTSAIVTEETLCNRNILPVSAQLPEPEFAFDERKKRRTFLLHLTDDILLRVFEFLRCQSLIQTGLTCSRFYDLAKKSSIQRTYDIARKRQLPNSFFLLRAKEQIYYADNNTTTDNDNHDNCRINNNNSNVPIPTLLPGRRVLVQNSGDPEYDGIYYCTDANGNGFVFTKPRFSSDRVSVRVTQIEAEAQQELADIPIAFNGGNNEDDDNFQPNDPSDENLINDRDNDNQLQLQNQYYYDSNDHRPLRCIIAKAYSNDSLLWYMSKEIEIVSPGGAVRKKTFYSFYAPLVLSGNSHLELCSYPSQSSALVRQDQGWRVLQGTIGMRPPTLEVIDQDDLHS